MLACVPIAITHTIKRSRRLGLAHFTDKEAVVPKSLVNAPVCDHTGSDDRKKTDSGQDGAVSLTASVILSIVLPFISLFVCVRFPLSQ